MKTLSALLAVPPLLLALAACAPVREESFPLEQDLTSLSAVTETGNIRATTVEASAAPMLIATIEGKRAEVRERRDGGHAEYELDCPTGALHCAADLEIFLPPGVSIDLRAESGNISVDSLEVGSIGLSSGSGDLALTSSSAETIELVVGSGNVRCTGSEADDVVVEAGSGDITLELEAAPASIDADAGSGDVRVTLPSGAYDVTASSGSGRVDVSGLQSDPDADSAVVARSGSGDVEIVGRP